jgi:hypothetical protein
MARVAKATKSARSTKATLRPGRSVAAAEKRKPGPVAKASVAAPRKTTGRAPAAPSAPKVSKDELRAHVEKLEQLVASFRAKSRESNKAAKVATARIAELEAQVAQLEKTLAAPPPPVHEPKPAKLARAKRRSREIDPGDAVPPGVAVEEPEPLDDEAETALENLDAHLSHD